MHSMNHARCKRLEIKGRMGGKLFPVGNSFLPKTGSIFPFSALSHSSARNPRNRNRFRKIAAAIVPSVFPCFRTLSPSISSMKSRRKSNKPVFAPGPPLSNRARSLHTYPCRFKQSDCAPTSRIVLLFTMGVILPYARECGISNGARGSNGCTPTAWESAKVNTLAP